MKVISVYNIKGRGTVAHVDTEGVPRGALKIGILVWQGARAWKVTGVEMGGSVIKSVSRIGLVLRGEGHDDSPETTELSL